MDSKYYYYTIDDSCKKKYYNILTGKQIPLHSIKSISQNIQHRDLSFNKLKTLEELHLL